MIVFVSFANVYSRAAAVVGCCTIYLLLFTNVFVFIWQLISFSGTTKPNLFGISILFPRRRRRQQCDQTARYFVKYLVTHNNENLPNTITIGKVGSKFCTKVNKPSPFNSHRLKEIVKVARFRQIWLHWTAAKSRETGKTGCNLFQDVSLVHLKRWRLEFETY